MGLLSMRDLCDLCGEHRLAALIFGVYFNSYVLTKTGKTPSRKRDIFSNRCGSDAGFLDRFSAWV